MTTQKKSKLATKPDAYESISAPKGSSAQRHRILIGIPTLGTVRIEWHNAVAGLVVPMNWGNSMTSPIGFATDDAQNVIAREALEKGFEWLLLIEDDVLVPPDLFIRLAPYLDDPRYPVVGGLYHLKSDPPQPMIFRGRGNGVYRGWKPGEKVWCDGLPTGCLLMHCSILRALHDGAEEYDLQVNGRKERIRRTFWTPRMCWSDPSLLTYQKLLGTSDLWMCDRILKEELLKKAGWPKLAKKQYPFLVDTAIRCGHIDRETGRVY